MQSHQHTLRSELGMEGGMGMVGKDASKEFYQDGMNYINLNNQQYSLLP